MERNLYEPTRIGEPRATTDQVYNDSYRVVSGNYRDPRRAEMIRETYRLLAVAVFAGMAGGYLGSHSRDVLHFFTSWPGLITAIMVLNFLPAWGMSIARNNPRLGVPYLGFHGFVAGLVLSPLVFIATRMSGASRGEATDLVQAALIITAAVFGAISYYVWKSGTNFQVGSGIMFAVWASLMGAILVNFFMLHSGLMATVISGIIGIFGGVILVHTTARVLNDPEFDDPVGAALALFAGLFNVFQAVLRLLLSSRD